MSTKSREVAIKNAAEYRALASLCRQIAAYNPDKSWHLLGQAEWWELASRFQECTQIVRFTPLSHRQLVMQVPQERELPLAPTAPARELNRAQSRAAPAVDRKLKKKPRIFAGLFHNHSRQVKILRPSLRLFPIASLRGRKTASRVSTSH